MDTLKTIKTVVCDKKLVKIIGVESKNMGWAEALTEKGIVRSFGRNFNEALSKVEITITHKVA